MRYVSRPVATLLGAGGLALALAVAAGPAAFAQANPPAPNAAAPAEPALLETPLTEQHVSGLLAAYREIDKLAEKLPDDPKAKPDPKIVKQLDDTAKKHGFKGYEEYSDVVETISLVLAGFDRKTKTYIGIEAALRQQIAAVEAEPKLSAEDKKQALAELNEALKAPVPPLKNKANIDLVTKHYAELSDALEEDE